MERSAKWIVALVTLTAFGLVGTAQAAWEAPKKIDTEGEDRGNTTRGDVAVGANGLATLFFFQTSDDGQKAFFTRRPGDANAWSAPQEAQVTTPANDAEAPSIASSAFELDANDAGTAGLALRATRTIPGETPIQGDTEVTTIFGGGWPSAVTVPTALKQLLGDDSAAATDDIPDVDVDGAGVGHVVAILNPGPTEPDTGNPAPPTNDGPEIHYGQFSTATGDRVAGSGKEDFVAHAPPTDEDSEQPFEPSSRPRIDVNEDGDVAISFVSEIHPSQLQDQQTPDKLAVFVARRRKGDEGFTVAQMSRKDEDDPVTQHDIAIAPDGTITLLYAADPDRGATSHRIYANRWLHTASGPRSVHELVSSSDEGRPGTASPRVAVDDAGNVTAAWTEGSALFSSQRTTNWNTPESLSTNAAAFDLAVDSAGMAYLVYREGTALVGRARESGKAWANADTISTAAVDTAAAPRVDADRPEQADVFFTQANGQLKSGYASRWTGKPATQEPINPPKPDTEDCPNDINIVPGDSQGNTLNGTAGRDTIMGGDGNDTVAAGGDDDCVRGQGGIDRLFGETGNDNVGGGNDDDEVNGGDGDDRVDGGPGVDRVTGSAGNDTGTGGSENDTVDGAGGNDILNGESGDDLVRGGTGADALGGGDGNDRVYGNTGNNVIFGGIGDDRLYGGSNDDSIVGEDGNDTIKGGSGKGLLGGGAGNDTVNGGSGGDSMTGDAGEDTLTGKSGNDTANGGAENDTVKGGSGKDRLLGDLGADRIFGDNGNDRIDGGADNDLLRGGTGKDRLVGGDGDDVANGGNGNDRVNTGNGDDRVTANDGKRDRINCGDGTDTVKADRFDRVALNCEKVKRVGKKKRRG